MSALSPPDSSSHFNSITDGVTVSTDRCKTSAMKCFQNFLQDPNSSYGGSTKLPSCSAEVKNPGLAQAEDIVKIKIMDEFCGYMFEKVDTLGTALQYLSCVKTSLENLFGMRFDENDSDEARRIQTSRGYRGGMDWYQRQRACLTSKFTARAIESGDAVQYKCDPLYRPELRIIAFWLVSLNTRKSFSQRCQLLLNFHSAGRSNELKNSTYEHLAFDSLVGALRMCWVMPKTHKTKAITIFPDKDWRLCPLHALVEYLCSTADSTQDQTFVFDTLRDGSGSNSTVNTVFLDMYKNCPDAELLPAALTGTSLRAGATTTVAHRVSAMAANQRGGWAKGSVQETTMYEYVRHCHSADIEAGLALAGWDGPVKGVWLERLSYLDPTHDQFDKSSATRVRNFLYNLFGNHARGLPFAVMSFLAANYLRHIREVEERSPNNRILQLVIRQATDTGIDKKALFEMGDQLQKIFLCTNSAELTLAEREEMYGSTVPGLLLQIVGSIGQLQQSVLELKANGKNESPIKGAQERQRRVASASVSNFVSNVVSQPPSVEPEQHSTTSPPIQSSLVRPGGELSRNDSVAALLKKYIYAGLPKMSNFDTTFSYESKQSKSEIKYLICYLLEQDGVTSRLSALVARRPGVDDDEYPEWTSDVQTVCTALQASVIAEVATDGKRVPKSGASLGSVVARLKQLVSNSSDANESGSKVAAFFTRTTSTVSSSSSSVSPAAKVSSPVSSPSSASLKRSRAKASSPDKLTSSSASSSSSSASAAAKVSSPVSPSSVQRKKSKKASPSPGKPTSSSASSSSSSATAAKANRASSPSSSSSFFTSASSSASASSSSASPAAEDVSVSSSVFSPSPDKPEVKPEFATRGRPRAAKKSTAINLVDLSD